MPSLEIVEIRLFDDGREEFKHYLNQWEVIEKKFGGQKLVLRHTLQPSVIINTISAWKTHVIKKSH